MQPTGFASLSRLSLGCATFGREIDADASLALMDHAYARGMTLFDTAASYSSGASEVIVGRWLASRRPTRGSLRVATKILPPFQATTLSTVVAESRQRLGGLTIDVLFLHRWDETAESDEVLVAFDQLVTEGHIATLGVSNYSATQLSRLLNRQARLHLAPCQLIQNNHNFSVREMNPALRKLCAARGVGTLTYSPLGAGFLTGKHRHGAAPNTRFTLIPGHQDVYFQATAFRRLDHLLAVSKRHAIKPEKLALAWACQEAATGSVIIGARSVPQLEQAFEVLSWEAPQILRELGGVE